MPEAIAAIEALLAPSVGAPPQAAAGAADQRLPLALVQLCAEPDRGANLRLAEAWLERALRPGPGDQRPRLLMLPEVWNAPYRQLPFQRPC